MKPYKSILSAILAATTLMTPQALPYLAQTEASPGTKSAEQQKKDLKSFSPFTLSKDQRFTLKHMPLDIRAVTRIESKSLSNIEDENHKNSSTTVITRLDESEWTNKDIPLFKFHMFAPAFKGLPKDMRQGKTSHDSYGVMSRRQLRRMESDKTEFLINGQWVKCQGHVTEKVIRDSQTGKLSTIDRMEIWVAIDESIQTPAVVIDRLLLPPNTVFYKRSRQIFYDGYEPRFMEVKAELSSPEDHLHLDKQVIPSIRFEITHKMDLQYHSAFLKGPNQRNDSWAIRREEMWFSKELPTTPILTKQQFHYQWTDPKSKKDHTKITYTTIRLSFEQQDKDQPKNWKPLPYKDLKGLIQLDEG